MFEEVFNLIFKFKNVAIRPILQINCFSMDLAPYKELGSGSSVSYIDCACVAAFNFRNVGGPILLIVEWFSVC